MKTGTWPEEPGPDAAFDDLGRPTPFDAVLAGRRRWDDPELVALAAARSLDRCPVDPLAVEVADRAPSLEELLRIATDGAPGIGNEAADRILGGAGADLRASDPIERHWLATAIAAAAFVVPDGETQEPWEFWARSEPVPSREERLRVRAVARAPWVAYRVHEDRWEPCFDVDPRWLPTAPPSVPGPVAPRAGSTWVARVIATDGGFVAPIAVPVRGLAWSPAVTTLVRRARSVDSRYSREMVLRRLGHQLVRLARPRCHPDPR